MTHFSCIRLAAALLSMLLTCGGAHAAAYGYSYTSVYGLVISNPSGSTTLLSNIDLSRTTATLNGSSVIHGGSNEIDAAQATRGAVTKGQNDFTPQGLGNASYARGDAQIVTSQIPPFPPGSTSTHTVNMAETYLAGGGSADASGREAILIHAANDALKELLGCIAPVTTLTGEGKGDFSGKALAKLKALVYEMWDKGEEVYLVIK